MRALFHQEPLLSKKDIDRGAALRLARQQRLTDEERPLRLVTIVYEAALHRCVGGPEVMREQLRHLVELAKLPTVTLQVLPLAGNAVAIPPANISLLSFPDPEDPEFLYVAHAGGSVHIENPAMVKQARVVFDRLRTTALSPMDSVALIERLAKDLHGA